MENDAVNLDSVNKEKKNKIRKAKELKIKHLLDEIKLLKSQLKTTTTDDIINAPPSKRYQAEIQNLEVKIIQQESQQQRLEDKLHMLRRMYRNACKILELSHNDVMDAEELEYMTEIIENKKNELMSQRNLIIEIKKIGWSNLPPKIADECKKTHLELEFVHSQARKVKEEVEELMEKLKENLQELSKIQKTYNEQKSVNNKLEGEIDEIINAMDELNKQIHSKQRKAEELEKVVKDIAKDINQALTEQKAKTKEEQEKSDKQKQKLKVDRLKKNKDLEDLEKKHKQLDEGFHSKTAELRKKNKLLNEYRATAKQNAKYNMKELYNDLEILKSDIDDLKLSLQSEIKQKIEYFNILEDMLGKLRNICRIRGGTDNNNNVQLVDEYTISIKGEKFHFDHLYDSNSQNKDIFEAVDYLYQMANIGFNCYIVTMGALQSGKYHLTIGPSSDGIIWLGLDKIKNVIASNKKNDLQTKFTVCSVEMTDDKIFDLIDGNLNENIEVKMDPFRMIFLNKANYRDCVTENDIKNILKTVLENRKKAENSLKSKFTSFVFLVTFQIYSKHQHRYWRGKLTHVKLASFNTMKVLNEELSNLTNGKEMNYKRNLITQLLEDCFGGNSKTCVIGTINPSSKFNQETIATLNMVSNLKKISNDIEKHSEPEKVYFLKSDIERLLRGLKPEH